MRENYTMLCDFYEFTMSNGYFQNGMKDQICYFDVFFRSVPDGIFARRSPHKGRSIDGRHCFFCHCPCRKGQDKARRR